MISTEEIYKLLYTDEQGDVIGLDEVQLVEEVPVERIPKLIDLLTEADLYVAYQAALVLAAWGVQQGIDFLAAMVAKRADEKMEFEPHRLWGEDNVYDVIADTLYIATLNGYNIDQLIPIYSSILKLYGEKYFESKLKYILIKIASPVLLLDIKSALERSLAYKRYYQASQLLPVLTKYDKTYALSLLPQFNQLIKEDDHIKYNLEEMKYYL